MEKLVYFCGYFFIHVVVPFISSVVITLLIGRNFNDDQIEETIMLILLLSYLILSAIIMIEFGVRYFLQR